ncbi:MAG: helix-turn-helix domain-containing protein [Clostridia bacterium]|nr:helix-turn-helix domain-containing protein [Clostridia bacterium]
MHNHPVWRFENQMPPGREFEIFHSTNTNPQPSIYQSHHFYELFFILRGSIRVIVEESDLSPALGDVLIYPPHCMHRVTHTDSSLPYERFYIYLSKEFLNSISTEDYSFTEHLERLTAGGRNCLQPGSEAVRELVPMADEIIEAARDTSPESIIANRCRMVIYLVRLLKLLEASIPTDVDSETTRMNEMIRYINQNAAQPLSLDQLAEVFGISKFVLLHEFKDYTGMSIYQYILTRRVILAQQLIQQGVKPHQACEQCGFTDYTSFYRAFKARTGKSPNQYAKGAQE